MDRNGEGIKGGQSSKVALRKESVDRNFLHVVSLNYKEVSLSARRAWIEILLSTT